MSVKFKVEEIRETASSLAIKLSEALNNVSLFLEESEKYFDHARAERDKLKNFEDLYVRVIERDKLIAEGKDPPKPLKRMDPIATFDATSLSKQVNDIQNRVAKFIEKAEQSKAKAEAEKVRSKLLQVEIRKAIDREKNTK